MARLRSFRGDSYQGTLVILDIARTAEDQTVYYSGVLLSEQDEPSFEWVREDDPRIIEGRESHMYVSPFLKNFGGRVGLGTKLREILENEDFPAPSQTS
ncbi:hypothetical protein [Alkalicoccus halolimnae]|uniref:Uncharacterized protein n=1 Tax=Alkalicoccus halolimnae TaxID=1667239 RepID=A0A5C7FE53_9BACI|nr:hypothetical protein [Alkalicoccus halolimnae]TXF85587.1 hypothetical protein FTX54_08340 [Alkalicoccus halolimnae]